MCMGALSPSWGSAVYCMQTVSSQSRRWRSGLEGGPVAGAPGLCPTIPVSRRVRFAMWRRFWRPETGIFLGLWLALLIGGQSRLFRDPGTFWHTVVGERILSSGELVYRDPFSCTFGGEPWIPHQ